MFMCFRYMNEIRINTKIPRLTDTRNHVCLPCDITVLFTQVPSPQGTSAYAESALPVRRGCIMELQK